MELIIGPRAYSTWSLRGWLVMRRTGQTFTTSDVLYQTEAQKAELRLKSPSGLAPVLCVNGERIWDTLAIAEWAAETFPHAQMWPQDATARAQARSATAEMHSGFHALRHFCGTGPDRPMVGSARSATPQDPALDQDLQRLVTLLATLRRRFGQGGAFLFGDWSIADAFYTPVAARVRHFQIDLSEHGDDGEVAAYLQGLLSDPDFVEWERLA